RSSALYGAGGSPASGAGPPVGAAGGASPPRLRAIGAVRRGVRPRRRRAGCARPARTTGVAPGEELVLPVSHGRPPVGHRSGDGPGRLAGDPAGLVGGDDRQVVRPERVDLATHALLGPHESGGAGGSPDPEPGQTLEHRTSLPDLQRRRGNQLGSSWRPGRRRRAARRVPEARATVLITGEVSAR